MAVLKIAAVGLSGGLLAAACGGPAATRDEPAATSAAACEKPGYPGPWAACPEAGWVSEIAEAAGYEAVGDTGSALVVAGDGQSFYLWATRGEPDTRGRPRCRLADAVVRGWPGMEGWRFWPAQRFTFWIAPGPAATSTSPKPCELRSLIERSLELAPPP